MQSSHDPTLSYSSQAITSYALLDRLDRAMIEGIVCGLETDLNEVERMTYGDTADTSNSASSKRTYSWEVESRIMFDRDLILRRALLHHCVIMD